MKILSTHTSSPRSKPGVTTRQIWTTRFLSLLSLAIPVLAMTKKEARRRRTSSADGAVTQEIFEVNDEESVGVGAEKEVGGKRKRDKEEEQRVGGDEGEMEVGEDTVSLISSDGQTLVVMAQLLRDES